MALEGILEEFGLADILQLIYFQKKTGTLNVDGKNDTVKIDLLEGNISGLESKSKTEESKLGKLLIKKGLITADNLVAVMDIQKEENVKIGLIFLRRGLVSKEILTETIKSQITESIVQVFAWSEGRYEFIPHPVTQDAELPIAIDTQHLLMDGLRTVDEWSQIEGKLELDTVYKLVAEPESGQLDETEKALLSLIDGESDVSTLINVSPSGDFDTSKALISMEEKGIIAPVVLKAVLEEKKPAMKLSEKSVIISTVVVAVLILFFTLKGNLDAFKAFSQTMYVAEIESIKRNIEIYNITNGRYPDNISDITVDRDVWDRPYIYKLKDEGFIFFSTGKDGIEGTDDDLY